MAAGAKTSRFPKWHSIRTRLKRCDLPEWDSVYVHGPDFKNFYITEKAAIAPMYGLRGISPWRGYDDPKPFGYAEPAELLMRLRFERNTQRYNPIAVINFTKNEHGVFMWWFPNMKVTADKNGEHEGWHPCALVCVPGVFVPMWLDTVMPVEEKNVGLITR